MTLPTLTKPGDVALFLDFDGTLVEIAERPDTVRVAEATRMSLGRLQFALGGALAIVTGREIEVIDGFLSPFRCPVAGVHGLTRRDYSGRAHTRVKADAFVAAAREHLAGLSAIEGLLVEPKSSAIALHYRGRPDLEAMCLEAMEAVVPLGDGVRLMRGKMVIEARPDAGDKGTAIEDFLAEPPFIGRTPVFAGDDSTDEDGFRLVNARGGMTLRIGPGETEATHRVADVATFLTWLAFTAETLEKGAGIA